ncbi:MAG TPA: hypothetical protein PKE45_02580, partial [Caldilineaceae bacterium]|nr:hypothetical protein [Caldilineaceae bacterium]
MRIFLDQIGCRLNYSEMETLAQRLTAVGHQMVETAATAQVIVLNTCAVTADAARAPRARFVTPAPGVANAARVTLQTETPLHFARMFTGADR